MANNLIELKIGVGCLKLDLVEVWRRLKGEKPRSEDGVGIVANRFKELFAGHELKLQQVV